MAARTSSQFGGVRDVVTPRPTFNERAGRTRDESRTPNPPPPPPPGNNPDWGDVATAAKDFAVQGLTSYATSQAKKAKEDPLGFALKHIVDSSNPLKMGAEMVPGVVTGAVNAVGDWYSFIRNPKGALRDVSTPSAYLGGNLQAAKTFQIHHKGSNPFTGWSAGMERPNPVGTITDVGLTALNLATMGKGATVRGAANVAKTEMGAAAKSGAEAAAKTAAEAAAKTAAKPSRVTVNLPKENVSAPSWQAPARSRPQDYLASGGERRITPRPGLSSPRTVPNTAASTGLSLRQRAGRAVATLPLVMTSHFGVPAIDNAITSVAQRTVAAAPALVDASRVAGAEARSTVSDRVLNTLENSVGNTVGRDVSRVGVNASQVTSHLQNPSAHVVTPGSRVSTALGPAATVVDTTNQQNVAQSETSQQTANSSGTGSKPVTPTETGKLRKTKDKGAGGIAGGTTLKMPKVF